MRQGSVLGVVFGMCCWFLADPAWSATCVDCDEDGFTRAEGDCNDLYAEANPGIFAETCGDRLDNDCNGFFDDGCDNSVRQGTIQGGGGCSGNAENAAPANAAAVAAFLAFPVTRLRRRRTPGAVGRGGER